MTSLQQSLYEAKKAATLWMGDVEPYMDDGFLINAFKQALDRPDNIVKDIKYPINRMTGGFELQLSSSLSESFSLRRYFVTFHVECFKVIFSFLPSTASCIKT